MPAFFVYLNSATGKTKLNGTDSMLVIAEDEEAALEAAQARYPGLAIWSEATVVDLEALEAGDAEADPPVEPFEGVFVELSRV